MMVHAPASISSNPITPLTSAFAPFIDSETSSIASDPDDLPEDESLYDRIAALKDVIPPTQRRQLGSTLNTTYTWGSWGMQGGLKLAWQISVSVLLLVAPFALASQEDMAIAMEEKQMMMQQSANEVSVLRTWTAGRIKEQCADKWIDHDAGSDELTASTAEADVKWGWFRQAMKILGARV